MVLKLSSTVSDVFLKVLKLSSEVSDCQPLEGGARGDAHPGRSLHSSPFRHNVSAFCGSGGALKGYFAYFLWCTNRGTNLLF